MKRILLGLAMTAIALPGAFAQDEFDDIYYNPKSKKETKKDSKNASNYIADFSSMDVDDYNRRGFYYETAVDTIGQTAENAEDFVYTQQIQKYYNPTIVVDNSDVLADILEDSYGNVEIVIDNGYPTFTSIYTGGYGWAPSYYNWCIRPSWSWNYAWGPFSWSWNWGPSWTWGPSWSWGYGPSWAYYPPAWGYYPPRPPHHGYYPPRPPHNGHYSYNRPGAGRPYAPNAGWSHNTRPGGNYNGAGSVARPGSRPAGKPAASGRPVTNTNRYNGHRTQSSATVGTSRPAGNRTPQGAVTNTTGRRVSGAAAKEASVSTNVKTSGTNNRVSTTKSSTNATKASGTMTTTTNRRSSTSTSTNRTTTTNSNRSTSTNNRSYNTTNRSTTSNRSYNTGTSRSSGGGAYRGGGGASRGGGGGGHRGGGGRR